MCQKKWHQKFENMFKDGPLLEAMTIYLSTMYEEAAEYDEAVMIREYNHLRGTNQLHLIFEAVEQYNSLRGEA